MTIRGFSTTRLVYVLLSLAFLGATEGEAFGLRHCPHHDALPTPESGGAAEAPHAPAAAAPDHDHPEEAAPGAVHDHSDSRGPCTCLQDCHVGSSIVGPTSDPGLFAALPGAPVGPNPLGNRELLRGPRHDLFELHLPNAPPAFPS